MNDLPRGEEEEFDTQELPSAPVCNGCIEFGAATAKGTAINDPVGHAALDFIARGWMPIPIPPFQKAPKLSNWQHLRVPNETVIEYFRPGANIGLLLGAPSNGLIDVDFDDDCARRLAQALPATERIHGRAGNPASHYWYQVTGGIPRTAQFKDPVTGGMLVELRSTGGQTVVPPAQYGTEEAPDALRWVRAGSPGSVDGAVLLREVEGLAAMALLSKYWPGEGSRNEAALCLAGMLLEGGMPDARAADVIEAVSEAANDEESSSRRNAVSSTRRKLDAKENVKGFRALAEIVDERVLRVAAQWFGLKRPTGADDQVMQAIQKLNQEYFVAPLGSDVEIFQERRDSRGFLIAKPMGKQDFQLKLDNKFVTTIGEDGRQKSQNLAKVWRTHPARREYDGIVLSPGVEVAGHYNRWRGFAVAPQRGNWRRIRWHILFVICDGKRSVYRYVLGWLAFAVQNPGARTEVALVLRGGRGVGKGMFVSAVGRLFGAHFLQVNNTKHLVGNFNAHLAECLLLFADEAFWAGDKAGESSLKAIITEDTLAIERKGFDLEIVPNRLKIIFASNNDWAIPAGLDERRFCVLAVSNIQQQNHAYFASLQNEIQTGGVAAMLDSLQRHDISKFDIRAVPQTDALAEQKLLSLDPFHRWWRDKLSAGRWSNRSTFLLQPQEWEWDHVPTDVVHDEYVVSLQKLGVSRRSSGTELGMALPRVLPDGWPRRVKRMDAGRRRDFYEFPSLLICRQHFERISGFRATWPSAEVEPVPPGAPKTSGQNGA